MCYQWEIINLINGEISIHGKTVFILKQDPECSRSLTYMLYSHVIIDTDLNRAHTCNVNQNLIRFYQIRTVRLALCVCFVHRCYFKVVIYLLTSLVFMFVDKRFLIQ